MHFIELPLVFLDLFRDLRSVPLTVFVPLSPLSYLILLILLEVVYRDGIQSPVNRTLSLFSSLFVRVLQLPLQSAGARVYEFFLSAQFVTILFKLLVSLPLREGSGFLTPLLAESVARRCQLFQLVLFAGLLFVRLVDDVFVLLVFFFKKRLNLVPPHVLAPQNFHPYLLHGHPLLARRNDLVHDVIFVHLEHCVSYRLIVQRTLRVLQPVLVNGPAHGWVWPRLIYAKSSAVHFAHGMD